MLNPFRYGIIVDEPFFIDREDEQKDIYQWLSTKQSIVLYSPRRYGKSSLIIKLLNQFKKKVIDITFEVKEGPRVFVERIDISGNVRTLDKVIRRASIRIAENGRLLRVGSIE